MKKYNQNLSSFVFFFLSCSTLYILIYNIFHYNPALGYDAEAHYNYVNYLSRDMPNVIKLPSSEETREFFNPPLGYIVPSVVQVFCRNIITSDNLLLACEPVYQSHTGVSINNVFDYNNYKSLYFENF